jgi:predicted Zn-ribbon and HTH transcriptional regulator
MVVKPKPHCRNCGTTLKHSLSRCPNCGKRSWINLFRGLGQRV